MKKTTHKFLSILLALIVVLGILPLTAFAEVLPTIQNVKIADGVLTWDAVEGATRYHVNYGHTSTSVQDTSFNLDERLAEGGNPTGTYRILLRAVNSSYSEIANWEDTNYSFTSPYEQLSQPTNVVWDGVTVKWDAVPNATSYTVILYYGTGGWARTKSVFGKTACFFDYSEFSTSNEYYATVTAEATGYANSADGYTPKRAFTSEDLTPPAIPNVQITADGIVTWDEVEGADEYYFSVSNLGGRYESCELNIKETLESVGKPTGTYTLKISARDSDRNTIAYKEVTYDYTAPKPRLPKATNLRWDGKAAKWDAVENATSYQVVLWVSGNVNKGTVEVTETEYDFTSQEFLPNTEYAFSVVAKSDDYIDSELVSCDRKCFSYSVNFPTAIGYKIADADSTTKIVEPNGSYSFTLTVLPGYEKTGDFKVSANGIMLTEVDGKYTISNIARRQDMAIQGVAKIAHVHDFSGKWKSDSTGHWRECPEDSEKGQMLPHNFGEMTENIPATCTATGLGARKCIDCGYEKKEDIPKIAHNNKSVITAPTCTEKGFTTYTCEACDNSYVDNYVDALGHTYKTTVTEATLTKDGRKVTTCTVCGNVKSTDTIYMASYVKLSTTTYTYDGSVKTPSVTVKTSKGVTLKKDTDYTVAYASGRKNAGKYAVTVTFKGNYSGTKTLYFTIVPPATSKISVSQTTSTIKATWSKVSGATGYTVYLYKGSKQVASKTVDSKTLNYTFKKLSAGTVYTVKVKAYKTVSKVKYWSSLKSLETATKTTTPKITKLAAGKKQATITLSNVSGESGYQVYYSTKKASGYKSAATLKANAKSTTVKKLTSKKTYYFKIRAYKKTAGGTIYSAWSTVKYVKVK